MIDFAKAQFALNAAEGEGDDAVPRRELLELAAAKGSVRAQAELAAIPPLPPLAGHVWSWFQELRQTRQHGMSGPLPISRQEIRVWEEDEGRQLQPWERKAILALDLEERSALAEQRRPKK